jgi:hypothetical protein
MPTRREIKSTLMIALLSIILLKCRKIIMNNCSMIIACQGGQVNKTIELFDL